MKTNVPHTSAVSRLAPSLVTVVACLLLPPSVFGQASLDRLRETFEAELVKIRKSRTEKETALHQQYVGALKTIEVQLQGNGDLDPLLVVREEARRFAGSSTVIARDVVASPADLRDLQNRYLAAAESIRVKAAGQITDLAARYDRTLASLQEQQTRAGQIETALAAKAERETARQHPAVTAAQFIEAEVSARTPAAPASPEVTAPAPVVPRAGAAVEPELAFDTSHKTRLSRRYSDLIEAILDRDWTTCMAYIDPEYREKNGTEKTTNALRLAAPFLRLADNADITVKAGSIEVDEETGTARLQPKAWWGNKWHDLAPTDWLLTDGDWFMKLGAGKAAPAGIQPVRGGVRGKRGGVLRRQERGGEDQGE